jgi:hypothetical protein
VALGVLSRSKLDVVRVRRGLARRIHALPRTLFALRLRIGLFVRAEATVRSRYRLVGEQQLRDARKSDTVFVFGSGYSINDLSPEEVAHFEEHDTFAFNWFARKPVLRVDYHLVREMSETDLDRSLAQKRVQQYCEWIAANPGYDRAILLIQRGLRATGPNAALGRGLFPRRNPVYRWRSNSGGREMTRSLPDGLTHLYGALSECVNFAVLLGWKKIVLVGVDLYDRRYFWLDADQTAENDLFRGASWTDTHKTATSGGIVDLLGEWADEVNPRGVEIAAYNPRSLLTRRLPVYAR